MNRKDTVWCIIAIVCAIALVTVSVVTDTPLIQECHVNTEC